MAPGWAWERIYEPLIRRAAGLGRLDAMVGDHAAPAETLHDHVDVLVVGAGVAGLAAARRLAASGLEVMLAEQDEVLGGGSLLDGRWTAWRETVCAALAQHANVRCLPRTTVLGAYGHGVFGALQRLAKEEAIQFGGMRERLRIIRARRVLLASGALERLIAFPGNDTPGVMLAGAALAYLRRYGVAAGRRPALFVNNDEAYQTAYALADAGIACAGVIDVRPDALASRHASARGITVHAGAVVEAVIGRGAVRGVRIAAPDGSHRRTLAADSLLISGGYCPLTSLASQLGASLHWQPSIAAFSARLAPGAGRIAGAARGVFGLAAAVRDAEAAAGEIAADLGRAIGALRPGSDAAGAELPPGELPPGDLPRDHEATPISALWEVPVARAADKAFVDLQNDVTCADVRLAQREGYEPFEHMER